MYSYQGGLEVSLQGGLDVTIPNYQLIQPTWQADKDGNLFENTTYSTLMIYSLQQGLAKEVAALGRVFMSQTYMMVNPKLNRVTVWPLAHTSQQQLVAVDDDGNPASSSCPTPAAGGSPGTAPSNSNGQNTDNQSAGISGGAVAGAVIGALVLVALVAAAAFMLVRRRRAAARAGVGRVPVPQAPAEIMGYAKVDTYPVQKVPVEMYQEQFTAGELSGASRPAELNSHIERGPQELPTERY